MLNQPALFGLIFALLMTALVGGFILLYPLSRRLGVLLEAKVRDQQGKATLPAGEVRELREQLHTLETEVGRIADRQQFMEQLLARRESDALPGGERDAR